MNLTDITKQIRALAGQLEGQNKPVDPYAELKAAHAAGKVIQFRSTKEAARGDWSRPMDMHIRVGIDWDYPIECFRVKPTESAKPDAPPFQLPPPPPGMQWHREDGWKAEDLPQGYRPCVKDERERISGYMESLPDRDLGWVGATYFSSGLDFYSLLHRTTRPLTFQHAGKQWAYHRPGDPMPCDGERFINYITVGDWPYAGRVPIKASVLNWGEQQNPRHAIVGWRYAEPATKEVELGPEDVPPGSVFRLKGGASEWFAPVSVLQEGLNFIGNVTSTQQFRSWYQLRKNHEINRSLPLTGKWNPEAWEPCHKIITTP